METIKVNMSPNPLDVQTIHASQNDGEARQWEFELHNNGELIDTSSVTEQLFFKSHKGGTEQLLPENTSTPTTSPFIGDIKYPQGLLTDQEFLYRESPTEEDGLAKITDIKGNTLVWNQLVPTNWVSTRTFSDGFAVTNNGDGSYTLNGTATQSRFPATSTEIKGIQGHKYYIQLLSSQNKAVISQNLSTVYVYSSVIYTAQNNNAFIIYFNANTYSNEKIVPMIIDLTQIGLDSITTIQEFTSLFPLSYYAYNQGSLLSFMGNGIKTTGKNLFDFSQFANGTITFENGVLTGTAGQFYSAVGIDLVYPKNTQITISFDARTEQNQASAGGGVYLMSNENGTSVQLAATLNNTTAIQHITVTIPSNRHIDKLGWAYGSGGNNIWHITNFQVEFGTTETPYEPYTESTLSLPISTYFPTGMKSAGSVYDEFTESKAITRIGMVDLGTLSWNHLTSGGSNGYWQATIGSIPNAKYISNYSGINIKGINPIDGSVIQSVGVFQMDGGTVSKIGIAQNGSANYQNASATVAPTGILYYELATESETSLSTASLVTENAEIPLSNEDGTLIGKCTEQLSENPGFFDAKIKLADADGECYSNKIQLHVERKPS